MIQLFADPGRWLPLAGLGLCLFLGLLHLALSQPANWRRVTGLTEVPMAASRRALGVALLAGSLALALWRDGVGFGLVLWFVALQSVGVALAAGLSWRPDWLARLALAPGATGRAKGETR